MTRHLTGVTLETDPLILAYYSDEQWDALLKATWVLPRPRGFIIVRSTERPKRNDFRPDTITPRDDSAPHVYKRDPALDDRRLYILRRLKEGARKSAIARELGVSNGLISKILSGDRR